MLGKKLSDFFSPTLDSAVPKYVFPPHNIHIDLVSHVMFVRKKIKTSGNTREKALTLDSPLDSPSQNFSGLGFWILNKGVISQIVRGLPCQNAI